MMQALTDFYDADERRRGDELHFGVGWRTPRYSLFEFSLFWIRDTRELCALRAPVRGVGPRGPFSNPLAPVPLYSNVQQQREEDLRIEVLAVLEEANLREVLNGWQGHVDDPAGFDWVVSRVSTGRTT